MRYVLVIALMIAVVASPEISAAGETASAAPSKTESQESWRAEFNDVCGKTQDAMTLPPDVLQGLVERCDRLEPQIAKLEESQKKVYLKRLQLCRGVFAYVLESTRKKK